MRWFIPTCLALFVTLAPPETHAQRDRSKDGLTTKTERVKTPGRGWFGNRRSTTSQTIIHPAPARAAAIDQTREEGRERQISEQHQQTVQRQALAELTLDRELSVSRAVAIATADRPLRPSTVAAPSSAQPAVRSPEPEPIPARPEPVSTAPTFVSAPPMADAAPSLITSATTNIDRTIEDLSRQLTDGEPEPATRSGLFALILVAMFVVPSTGVVLLFIGLTHLRNHSFVTGTVWLVIGGAVLWSSVIAAQHVFPGEERPAPAGTIAAPATAVGARTALSEELWTPR